MCHGEERSRVNRMCPPKTGSSRQRRGGFVIIRYLTGQRPERRARRVTADVLSSLGVSTGLWEMEEALAELVTNARRHAPGPYQLRIYLDGSVAKVAVVDGGTDYSEVASRLAQAAEGVPSLEESGRGLQMIAALFPGSCGVEPALAGPGHACGKQVWITTPLPPLTAPRASAVPS